MTSKSLFEAFCKEAEYIIFRFNNNLLSARGTRGAIIDMKHRFIEATYAIIEFSDLTVEEHLQLRDTVNIYVETIINTIL